MFQLIYIFYDNRYEEISFNMDIMLVVLHMCSHITQNNTEEAGDMVGGGRMNE